MDHGASSYRRYLDGDEAAFEEIVKEYFDSLVFFIDRYVDDFAAAEDIALDAFTQLVVNKRRHAGTDRICWSTVWLPRKKRQQKNPQRRPSQRKKRPG